MATSQDHYCRREIEETTVLRDVDFSAQAGPCLVFVNLNEFGVAWSVRVCVFCVCVFGVFLCVCVCVCEEKMEVRSAATAGLISKTHLIDFSLRHSFVFLFDESTDMLRMSHVVVTWRGAGNCLVYEYVIIPVGRRSTQAAHLASSLLHHRTQW